MPNLRLTDAQVADVATYLMTLKEPGGDAAKATSDQKDVDDVLLDYLTGGDAVRGREGGSSPSSMPTAKQHRARASASSAGTAASAVTTSRASRRRSRSAPTCPKRAASWSRGSTSRSSPTSRTRRRSAGSDASCTTRASSTRGACCSRSTSCACRTSTSPTSKSIGCVTAIMSFQREIQPPAAMPVQNARRSTTWWRAGRSSTGATASAVTSSRATAATS